MDYNYGGVNMKGLLFRWLINSLALFLTAQVVKDFTIDNFLSALVAALMLGVINAIIRPIVVFLTLPINILTLGLFTFVINGLMILLVSNTVEGFHVSSFWSAMVGSIILTIISSILSFIIKDKDK